MMKLQILIFGTLVSLITKNDTPCDCDYKGPFLEMAKHTPLVALIKVTRYLTFKDISQSKIPLSMDAELIEIYKGRENHKNITVWGDNGILCRPFLSEFKEGQYYVIAFYIDRNDQNNTEYEIGSCGAYWLNVDFINSTVSGDVNSKDRTDITLSLNKFKNQLKVKNICSDN